MKRETVFAILLLAAPCFLTLPTSASAQGFIESWETLPLGPVRFDDNGLFRSEEGTWVVGDTVSEFPECGPTPHRIDVVSRNGEKALRLTSNESVSSGGCSDNVWVVLQDFVESPINPNPGFAIPINANSVLSFEQMGSLVSPGPIGPATCVSRPCGDNISLILEDVRGPNSGYVLVYVLQRAPGQQPNPVPTALRNVYIEIYLDPDAGTYRRNLIDDFSRIPGYNPNGATIKSSQMSIDEHGAATIDNIAIGTPPAPVDNDGDGVSDDQDNCPRQANRNQLDTDADGAGNVCDEDDDNDGLSDVAETGVYATNPLLADTDGDGRSDGAEVADGTNPRVNEAAILLNIIDLLLE